MLVMSTHGSGGYVTPEPPRAWQVGMRGNITPRAAASQPFLRPEGGGCGGGGAKGCRGRTDRQTVAARVLILLVIALAGVLALPLLVSPGESPSPAPGRAPSTHFHYISMKGAAENAFKYAKEWYGLSLAGALGEGREDAACPSHVPARKGQLFWCQAILDGILVPIQMELTSSLGFVRPIKVGENLALWEQVEIEEGEEAEEEWCYNHPVSPAC